MPKIQITWSKLIQFDKESIEKLGDGGGVYRISKKAPDGKYYVFLVGSSENIKEKLLSHISDDEKNIDLKDFLLRGGDFSFKYAVIKEKDTREAVERQMYKRYVPEYNQEEPKSSLDIEANLN